MKKLFLILSCGVLLFSSRAEAFKFPCRDGWYVGGYIGANYINNFKLSGGEPGECTHYKLNCGGVALLSAGYQFCNSWRLEEEGGYRWNTLKGPHHRTSRSHPRSGHYQLATAFTNLYFDLPRVTCLAVKPYLGAGVGYAWSQMKSSRIRLFNGTHGGVAWQFIAGISSSFCVDYDYFADFRYVTNRAVHNSSRLVGSYSFGIGLRRYF